MRTRLIALISREEVPRRVKHYQGIPPEIAPEGQDTRKLLPWPRVLLVEEKPDGIFLFRFGEDGSFSGDTWHTTIEDAKKQAEYEYDDALGEWTEIPPEIIEPVAFALKSASK